jgi:5-methyltetrahydrofolate--homocysteine methyltransferase
MMDEIPEAELYETFSLQCKALQDGGADAILIETFSAIDEALIAIKAAKENTSLEVICTFTFELTIDGRYKTMMGIEPKQYVEEMLKAGVDIIGTNCGNGFERMVDIIKELRSSNKDIPILVHANAGLPRIENGKIIYPETPEIIKKFVPSLLEAGVNIIGGCCGTTPSHIKAISRIINLGT